MQTINQTSQKSRMNMESTEVQLCQAMTMSLNLGTGMDLTNKNTGEVLEPEEAQNLNLNAITDIESTPDIIFNPPVGIQRYVKVRQVLESLIGQSDPNLLKSIFEVGCANLRLHPYLKRLHDSVQKLVYIDIDEFALEYSHREQLNPLSFEYLTKRPAPLVVEAYAGDIMKCDPKVLMMDPPLFCVVAIEVIEHLYPEVLEGFEKTVFGVLSPPAVIVTTPNAEFNVVFRLAPGYVRHWDHKFEWTRAEFDTWCSKICADYLGYTYATVGIGEGPPGTEAFGCVSQMAVFTKNTNAPVSPHINLNGIVEENSYKLITRIEYPFEKATLEEIILREFECFVTCYVLNPSSLDEYMEHGLKEISLRLDRVLQIYGMPKVDKSKILEVLMQAGKPFRFNEATGEYEVIIQIPEQGSRWPPSDEEDSGNNEPSSADDSGVVTEMDEELW